MKSLAAVLAALALGGSAAFAQRLPLSSAEESFSAEALVRGTSATAAACAQLRDDAVWADAGAHGAECIRYWAAGLGEGSRSARVLVYLPPDQLAFDVPDPGYAARSPASLRAAARQMQAEAGVPFVLLARPGIFGSSGEHKQRRREAEARLVSAALDEIARRHGVREFALAGLSGGGHTVAALLAWRADIVCAVAASAVSSPRLRWSALGRQEDLTGHADSHEPVDALRPGLPRHPGLRVFVVGDPQDGNVPWRTQLPLAQRLQEIGVPVETVQAQGSDPQRHALSASARTVGALCARDAPTPAIRDLAARGLKG